MLKLTVNHELARARQAMIDQHLIPRGIRDQAVLRSLQRPRCAGQRKVGGRLVIPVGAREELPLIRLTRTIERSP